MDNNLVSRNVGRRLSLTAAGTARVFFGPFDSGEHLKGVYVNAVSNRTPALAGGSLQVDVRVFNLLPPDDTTAFLANGRPVTQLPPLSPLLPIYGPVSQVVRSFLPIGHHCDGRERYVGLEFTELNNDTVTGSCWAEVESFLICE